MESIGECWRRGQQRLASAGIDAARLEARLLLAWVTGLNHGQLLSRTDDALAPSARNTFDTLVARRAAGEPLAYVLGASEFRGRLFRVSPAVLIPRADTEVLVDEALARLSAMAAPRVLDLGTGSGIVAISLALESAATVVAVDVSPPALALARENAALLGAAVDFRQGDWFGPVAGERFDLIVGNPPYIAQGDPHLALNGLDFEPRLALTDGAAGGDGTACLRRIIAKAPNHLKPGGWLLLEHGYDQGAICRNLLAGRGFKDPATHPDLAGLDRVSGGLFRCPINSIFDADCTGF